MSDFIDLKVSDEQGEVQNITINVHHISEIRPCYPDSYNIKTEIIMMSGSRYICNMLPRKFIHDIGLTIRTIV